MKLFVISFLALALSIIEPLSLNSNRAIYIYTNAAQAAPVEAAQSASPFSPQAADFRQLLIDVIQSTALNPEAQPQAIRHALSSRPWFFKWIAETDNLGELMVRAGLGNTPSPEINVRDILKKGFASAGYNQAPESDATAQKVSIFAKAKNARDQFKKYVTFKSPETGKTSFTKIKVFWGVLSNVVWNFTKSMGKASLSKLTIQNLANQNEEQLTASLSLIRDDEFKALATQIEQKIRDYDVEKNEGISTLTATATKFPLQNDALNKISNGLARYFNYMSIDEKRALIIDYLKLSPDANFQEQMQVMLKHMGPGLLKVIQYIVRELQIIRIQQDDAQDNTELDKVIETLKTVESNVEPFPKEIAIKLIEERFGKPIDQIFLEFNPEPHPIASGTIGAVYAAKLLDGTEVVVKVLRPGIHEQLNSEMDRLVRVIDHPEVKKFIDDFRKLVGEEMDFVREAAYLKKLQKAYDDKEKGIYVPQAVPNMVFSDVLVLKKFNGIKISQFSVPSDPKQTLLVQGELLMRLTEKWFDEAVFGSGDYHGDLHPGNILVRIAELGFDGKTDPHNEDYVKVKIGNQEIPVEMAIIDGGNAGSLSLELRRHFVEIVLAAVKNSPELMAKTLIKLSREPVANPEAFAQGVKDLFAKHTDLSPRLNKVITFAVRKGVMLPDYLLSFYRAKSFLEKQVDEVNLSLDKLDPAKELKRFSYNWAYGQVAVKRVTQDLISQTFSGSDRKLISGSEVFDVVASAGPSTIIEKCKDGLGGLWKKFTGGK